MVWGLNLTASYSSVNLNAVTNVWNLKIFLKALQVKWTVFGTA